MTPEQRLFQEVVLRAVMDATAEDPCGRDNILAKRAAHSWLTTAGRDFRQVCNLAGLDPEFIRDRYAAGCVDGDLLRYAEKKRAAQ